VRRAVRVLVLAAGLSGCGGVTWINDLATSPDGKHVVVVGARYQKHMLSPPSVDRPMRWLCNRDGSGALQCTADKTPLPQPK